MNVLIVDDHAVVKEGLALLIQDAFQVKMIQFASEGWEAIKLVMQFPFDLIILDLSMPDGLDGMQTLIEMQKLQLKSKIVIFSMYDEEVYQQKAYQNGADGFLVKRLKGEELIKSLEQILAGKKVFSNLQTTKTDGASSETVILDLPLSPREKEVFTMTVLGHSQKEIAERMGISVKTVENHRQHISEKLSTKKRSDWLEIAKKYNLFYLY